MDQYLHLYLCLYLCIFYIDGSFLHHHRTCILMYVSTTWQELTGHDDASHARAEAALAAVAASLEPFRRQIVGISEV